MYMENEVRKGIQWLDEEVPDWRESINRDRLDMGHIHDCILGQVFGDYDDACYTMGLPLTSPDYGFYLPDEEISRYPELRETWIALMDQVPERVAA